MSVCVSLCPLIVARQPLGKIPPIAARQRLGRNVTAVTNTSVTLEELLNASFSMWPVSHQGKQAISSSQNVLSILQLVSSPYMHYHNFYCTSPVISH
jgi:hypothetical protein